LEDDDDDLSPRQLLSVFTAPRLLPIYAVIVINMFLVGILFGFLPVYLYAIGYTPLQSGAVVSLATLSYLLVQPLAGALADRVDIRRTVLAGLLLAALAIGTVTFSSGVPLLAIVALAGLGVGTVWTNSDALVSKLADPSRMGVSIGAAQSFKELGDMIGPLLIGALTQFLGVRAGFVICGALGLLFVLVLGMVREAPLLAR
jgi:MFS family permease